MNKPTREELEAQSSKLTDAVMTCVSKVEELQAQVKQLAAENAALKDFISTQCFVYDAKGHEGDAEEARPSTPATDAILASLHAEGVDMLAAHHQSIVDKLDGDSLFGDGIREHSSIAAAATHFAAQLRSKSEVRHD